MRNRGMVVLVTVCWMAAMSWAQATKDQAKPGGAAKAAAPAKSDAAQKAPEKPKPAPEVKRLAYFVGNWTTEGTAQPSDFGPGGKWTGKDHTEWFPGGFFLVTHSDGTMEKMGNMKELAVLGYDAGKKVYTYHAISSMGEDESSTGTVSGSDWTWTSDATLKGKAYKNRFLIHEDSPTAYTMKFEASADGGKTWKTLMDGKATKAAPAAK